MKFKSRKDSLFTIFVFGFSMFFLGMFFVEFSVSNQKPTFWEIALVVIVIDLLLWIYFGTGYELTKKVLKYKSGPFRGKIEIDRIHEVIKNKTLWGGMKPATARKGLIIKYNAYDEIYISPKTNELFIMKLLELNPSIKVSE